MLTITPEDPATLDSQALINELSNALRSITSDSGATSFDADDVRVLNARFVVARNASGEAIGCGAFRPLAGRVAEIERMYSRPGNPGTGSAILKFLESVAAGLGYDTHWLETRIANHRAVEFYQSREYNQIPNIGKYVGNPSAVCFEKKITERLVGPSTAKCRIDVGGEDACFPSVAGFCYWPMGHCSVTIF